jgi:hypothetical protein
MTKSEYIMEKMAVTGEKAGLSLLKRLSTRGGISLPRTQMQAGHIQDLFKERFNKEYIDKILSRMLNANSDINRFDEARQASGMIRV